MNYVGVDIHKKYNVLCALAGSGRKLREARVEGNAPGGFAQFFASLTGPSKAVVEACWNWGLIHDELEELDQVEETTQNSSVGPKSSLVAPRSNMGMQGR